MEEDVIFGRQFDFDLLRVVVSIEAVSTAENADVDLLVRRLLLPAIFVEHVDDT